MSSFIVTFQQDRQIFVLQLWLRSNIYTSLDELLSEVHNLVVSRGILDSSTERRDILISTKIVKNN